MTVKARLVTVARLTSDPSDPDLTRGVDDEPTPQAQAYLILSDEERARGFIRPVRRTYFHEVCGTTTTMAVPIAETYARRPDFYGATYCVRCGRHLPVDEFVWCGVGGVLTEEKVGS